MNILNKIVERLTRKSDTKTEENPFSMSVPKTESLRLVIPGALDFSLVFMGDREEVMDEVFRHMEELLEFMSERSDLMTDALKTQIKERQPHDFSVA